VPPKGGTAPLLLIYLYIYLDYLEKNRPSFFALKWLQKALQWTKVVMRLGGNCDETWGKNGFNCDETWGQL
jgi:hypothetical protein